jgi:hypothetical protein
MLEVELQAEADRLADIYFVPKVPVTVDHCDTMVYYNYVENYISIPMTRNTHGAYFNLYHEFRHHMQHATGTLKPVPGHKDFMWKGVVYPREFECPHRYHDQPWEIDANDFAELHCNAKFEMVSTEATQTFHE